MNKETEELNIGELLLNFRLAKSRSDIFNFLYEVNYEGNSLDLAMEMEMLKDSDLDNFVVKEVADYLKARK